VPQLRSRTIELFAIILDFLKGKKPSRLFNPEIYERAKKTLSFLYQLHNQENGFLPDYGNNDGSLFFPLNGKSYHDYRPQLNALHYAIYKKHLYPEPEIQEDVFWLGEGSGETLGLVKSSNIKGYDLWNCRIGRLCYFFP